MEGAISAMFHRDGTSRKSLSKSGSYDNIEQLSADLIARGREVRDVERCSATPPARSRDSAVSGRSHQVETTVAENAENQHAFRSFLASSRCESDNLVSQAALPASHSKWLFGVSWLSFVTAFLCAYCGLWDLLIVPLGVGINSVNYWRKPDYGWRRYVDIIFIQFAIPYSCYKAYACAEPYRSMYYVCLVVGISFFGNACRLCCRPAHGRWSDFCKGHPEDARRLAWSTANHFLLHVMCNVGNAALFVGLHATRVK